MRDLVRIFALFTQLGLTIVAAIFLGGAFGVGLEHLGLGKAGLLLGILTGLGGAGVGAVGLVRESLLASGSTALPPPSEDETWTSRSSTTPTTPPTPGASKPPSSP